MKQSITFSQFCDAFRDMGRNEQFSYEAKRVLFDYLEQYTEETGEEVELDVIALCCEYSEDDFEDIAANYNIDLSDIEDEDDKVDAVRDYLAENTSVCGQVGNSFVYQQF